MLSKIICIKTFFQLWSHCHLPASVFSRIHFFTALTLAYTPGLFPQPQYCPKDVTPANTLCPLTIAVNGPVNQCCLHINDPSLRSDLIYDNPVFWMPFRGVRCLWSLDLCLIARETTRDSWIWVCFVPFILMDNCVLNYLGFLNNKPFKCGVDAFTKQKISLFSLFVVSSSSL